MRRFTATPTEPTSAGGYNISQNGFLGWQVTPLGIAASTPSRTLADWMNDAEERIAELEAENARLRAEYARLESAFVQLADKDIAIALINLDKARLLLVAIDENLDMDVNPLTYTTRRIVELLRDPARNPWASLMRAGKEGGKR